MGIASRALKTLQECPALSSSSSPNVLLMERKKDCMAAMTDNLTLISGNMLYICEL